ACFGSESDIAWMLMMVAMVLVTGLVASPDSISVFSAHPGVIHRNITLENPCLLGSLWTASDITVQLELSHLAEMRRGLRAAAVGWQRLAVQRYIEAVTGRADSLLQTSHGVVQRVTLA
ncbi:unnamed protein product, partial [Symbiodinium sp. KB8]